MPPNKHELELLIDLHKLDLVLISETHFTERSRVCIPGFVSYTTNHPDGKAHGGTAIFIKSLIKHHQEPSFKSDFMQATSIGIEDNMGNLTISSVYCPPKHVITEEKFSLYLRTLGNRFLSGGDWNAKHTHWGSRLTTTRGRELKKVLKI